MVAMSMSDEDVRHRFIAYGVEQLPYMLGVVGPRIDDRHLAAANDVTDRPFERERAWIVGHDPPQAGHWLVSDIGLEVEIFIEGNVIVHTLAPGLRDRPTTISDGIAPPEGVTCARIDAGRAAGLANHQDARCFGIEIVEEIIATRHERPQPNDAFAVSGDNFLHA